jgi:hypothetical protein
VGASCIFPLLALHLHPTWTFIASDINPDAINAAQANIDRNGLGALQPRNFRARPPNRAMAFPAFYTFVLRAHARVLMLAHTTATPAARRPSPASRTSLASSPPSPERPPPPPAPFPAAPRNPGDPP